MELPYAALQQMCSPHIELVEQLPEPQREALGVAFGLRTGAAPNQFLVGLAILGPLRELDEVAYLRFASVYRSFESAEDFERENAGLA